MNTSKRVMVVLAVVVAMVLAFASVWAGPQAEPVGTAFTYQGQLKLAGTPVTDDCDMEFRLYADAGGTSQVGSLVSLPVSVTEGFFTAQLDFGSDAFTGSARWLGIKVQCPGDPSMVDLAFQPLAASPYALALPGLYTQQQSDPLLSPNLIGGYEGNWVGEGIWGATISGGGEDWARNRVLGNLGTIGGGTGNQAGSDVGTIFDSELATVGGGASNSALGAYSTVGGGIDNSAAFTEATIAGGTGNSAENAAATIGGGAGNLASGAFATIAGGGENVASGEYNATVGGGYGNSAGGTDSTVAGGNGNSASHWAATVGGGYTNSASGPGATVPGGEQNTAAGAYSFAAGLRANASHSGAFVWADNIDQDLASTADNQFLVRATGGVDFYTGEAPFRVNGGVPWAGSQYANVVVVAKEGGDFTSIQEALDSIDSEGPSNRFLVWVAPGDYEERVFAGAFIDIVGAGEELTKITYHGAPDATPTVMMGWGAELRSLTVENTGGDAFSVAIIMQTVTRLRDVTVSASGGSDHNIGIQFSSADTDPILENVTVSATGGQYARALTSANSRPTISRLTATASGATVENIALSAYDSVITISDSVLTASGAGTQNRGMQLSMAEISIRNCTVMAEGGTYNRGIYFTATAGEWRITVDNSRISGSYASVEGDSTSRFFIGGTRLEGGAVIPGTGTATCAGVYDEDYVFYPDTCP